MSRRIVASPGGWLVWGAVAFFLINLLALVGEVIINSFGTRWFDAWLPEGLTTRWYSQAWSQFAVFDTLVVTRSEKGALATRRGSAPSASTSAG